MSGWQKLSVVSGSISLVASVVAMVGFAQDGNTLMCALACLAFLAAVVVSTAALADWLDR